MLCHVLTDFVQLSTTIGTFSRCWDSFTRTFWNFIEGLTNFSGGVVRSTQFNDPIIGLTYHLAWKIVFESLWKTFDSRFEFILENLRKHRDLIDLEANAIDIVEAKAWRSKQLEEDRRRRVERAEDLDRMERERLARQVREAVAWLGANEEQEDTFAKASESTRQRE